MGSLPKHVGVGVAGSRCRGGTGGGTWWCLDCDSFSLNSPLQSPAYTPLLPFRSKLGSTPVCYLTFLSFTCKRDMLRVRTEWA